MVLSEQELPFKTTGTESGGHEAPLSWTEARRNYRKWVKAKLELTKHLVCASEQQLALPCCGIP